jgi:hypothetical protein
MQNVKAITDFVSGETDLMKVIPKIRRKIELLEVIKAPHQRINRINHFAALYARW